jgi:hypothetical protein
METNATRCRRCLEKTLKFQEELVSEPKTVRLVDTGGITVITSEGEWSGREEDRDQARKELEEQGKRAWYEDIVAYLGSKK